MQRVAVVSETVSSRGMKENIVLPCKTAALVPVITITPLLGKSLWDSFLKPLDKQVST